MIRETELKRLLEDCERYKSQRNEEISLEEMAGTLYDVVALLRAVCQEVSSTSEQDSYVLRQTLGAFEARLIDIEDIAKSEQRGTIHHVFRQDRGESEAV